MTLFKKSLERGCLLRPLNIEKAGKEFFNTANNAPTPSPINLSENSVKLFLREPQVLQSRLTPHVVVLLYLTQKGNFSIVSS